MLTDVSHFIQFDFDYHTAMVRTIKLFQRLDKVFESLGIYMSRPKLKDRLSFRCYIFTISLIIISHSTVVYFLFNAKSVADRGDAFYIWISQYSNLFYIVTYARQAPEIRHFIENFEKYFQNSKC